MSYPHGPPHNNGAQAFPPMNRGQQQAYGVMDAGHFGGPAMGMGSRQFNHDGAGYDPMYIQGMPQSHQGAFYGGGDARGGVKRTISQRDAPPAGQEGSESEADEDGSPRKRKKGKGGKNANQERKAARAWSAEEETRFVESLNMHGRDWKKGAAHVGTRDSNAFRSHAQKYFIKLYREGKPLPPKVLETGDGYTLSGKPLDPQSASARNYLKAGLRRRAGTSKGADMGGDDSESSDEASRPFKAPLHGQSGRSAASTPINGSPVPNMDDGTPRMDAHRVDTSRVPNSPRTHVGQSPTPDRRNHLENLIPVQNFPGRMGDMTNPLSQKFEVKLDSHPLAILDWHAHLTSTTVIGLLGGTYDPETRILHIIAAFPCRNATSVPPQVEVEMDPDSEVDARAAIEEANLLCVGWYHSHCNYAPDPSHVDVENEFRYQEYFRDPNTGVEPFVGIVMSPYDQPTQDVAHYYMFQVVKAANEQGELVPTPMRVEHEIIKSEVIPEMVERCFEDLIEFYRESVTRVKLTDISRYTGVVRGPGLIMPHGITKQDKIKASLRHWLLSPTNANVIDSFTTRITSSAFHKFSNTQPQYM